MFATGVAQVSICPVPVDVPEADDEAFDDEVPLCAEVLLFDEPEVFVVELVVPVPPAPPVPAESPQPATVAATAPTAA